MTGNMAAILLFTIVSLSWPMFAGLGENLLAVLSTPLSGFVWSWRLWYKGLVVRDEKHLPKSKRGESPTFYLAFV